MNKDVLITIKGVQRLDEAEDTVELTTLGRFYRRGGIYYISYDDSEATGYEGAHTTLKVEQGCVTMRRTGGDMRSELVIEKGMRHQCYYDTGYGPLMLGIAGSHMVADFSDEGGELNVKYTLDLNASMASENELTIHVREVSPS